VAAAAAHLGGVGGERDAAEKVADVGDDDVAGVRRQQRGRARAAAGGARLREVDEDDDEDAAVPFPGSGWRAAVHGDGGGR
jgi:hypothetical protein